MGHFLENCEYYIQAQNFRSSSMHTVGFLWSDPKYLQTVCNSWRFTLFSIIQSETARWSDSTNIVGEIKKSISIDSSKGKKTLYHGMDIEHSKVE